MCVCTRERESAFLYVIGVYVLAFVLQMSLYLCMLAFLCVISVYVCFQLCVLYMHVHLHFYVIVCVWVLAFLHVIGALYVSVFVCLCSMSVCV